MDGRAVAPAAGTILNALANGRGAAFAIDIETSAMVSLSDDREVTGTVAGVPEADASLIERCVELTVETHGDGAYGGTVRTESDVPMASGLKSSSAAANATVLATLDALGVDDVPRENTARLGVQAAREVGVTATGAFDDASASMLGGVTVTDNTTDELLHRDEVDWDVLVWTPPEQSFSADTAIDQCRKVAPVADLVAAGALDGQYVEAMTANGFAFCAALDYPTDPMLEALPAADGVSLSGTGPSYVAVGDRTRLEEVRDTWTTRNGTTTLTTTRTDGARIT